MPHHTLINLCVFLPPDPLNSPTLVFLGAKASLESALVSESMSESVSESVTKKFGVGVASFLCLYFLTWFKAF